MRVRLAWLLLLVLCVPGPQLLAQKGEDQAKNGYDPSLFKALRYRPIGPFRGGRSAAVCGVPGKPMTFYFGATGGGVWETTDGGATWKSISDGFFGGSIGAVEVSTADPNVIYVGGGEKTVRGNVAYGDGVWKSTDAGKTWKHMGLGETRHIPRIRTHPKNPDLVYVAALGHLYGKNPVRGVFRSKDGGKTWDKILFVSAAVGAYDLVLDPSNPRILYASFWRVQRTPYSLESGGPGSGLWKSTDGGDTWQDITHNKGLPTGTVGIISVAVSPVEPQRVWALVEAEDGGIFRSEDGGKTWAKVNGDRNLRQRAWYFTRIFAGPKNREEVYVTNVQFWRSGDSGKTFQSIGTPHGDHHDLWIDPQDPARMIVGDDGGAQVTFNGGKTWSTYHNQPTAQFYRVTTDNHFPYRIYGAQQDNSTVRILSRSDGVTIGEHDWEPTAGSESGWIAVSPRDPEVVYGGNYGGYLSRVNHRTKEVRNVSVWPDNPLGHGAADLKYRFQWNFPLFFSPHDPDTLYAAANVLFKTTNGGQTWFKISPDLTRDDKSKQQPSGGPITKDNTSVEYYCTIFAATESPLVKGLLWCGSDDGLVHVSRNGGKSWKNVTPPDLPEWAQINSVEAHPFEKGGLYLAATRYKLDDNRPYLYKTTDYGKTWQQIVTGIKDDHFTRVIRADSRRRGLLYAGTEQGMYISVDDGAHWQPFQLNLPIVPITDLAVKNDDLIVATQGRSFWVLDDLTPLQQFKPEITTKRGHLFQPRPTYRLRGGATPEPPLTAGQNPPAGVVLHYYFKEAPAKDQAVSIDFLDGGGQVIRRFATKPKEGEGKLEPKAGINRMVWDLRYASAESFPGMIIWGALFGPRAVPGTYQARLNFGEESQTVSFEVLADPRSSATPQDLKAQFAFLLEVRNKLTETHRAIKQLRDVREQINTINNRLGKKESFQDVAKAGQDLVAKMTKIEETLYQTKNQSSQDPLNFPIRLNNKLAGLSGVVNAGDNRPTDQAVQVKIELVKEIDAELAKLRQLLDSDLPRLNAQLRQLDVPVIFPTPAAKKKTPDK
jgi:photosystem II stability/assembly factor-like uncharacterized protein